MTHGRSNPVGKSEASAAQAPGLGTILLLGSFSVFASISIEMYLPALPVISADLKAWPGAVELTISSFLIALAAGQLIYGPLSDRIGRRPPLLFGLSLYCLASIACAMAVNVEQLIAFRFLQALGGCAGSVVARAMVRDRFPANRVVHVLSLMSLLTGLSPLLSPLAGGAILHFASWRVILGSQAAFGIAILLIAVLMMKEPERHASRPSTTESWWSGFAAVARQPRTVGYALSGGLGGSVLFVYGACFPAIAMGRFGLSPQQMSWLLAAGAGMMMVCAQMNRPLLRRFTSDQILRSANSASVVIAMGLCVIAWSGRGGFVGLVAPLLIILGLRGLSLPHASAQALLSETKRVGLVSALVGAGSFAWGAAFAAIPGRLADGTARPFAATILAALALAALAIRWTVPKAAKA